MSTVNWSIAASRAQWRMRVCHWGHAVGNLAVKLIVPALEVNEWELCRCQMFSVKYNMGFFNKKIWENVLIDTIYNDHLPCVLYLPVNQVHLTFTYTLANLSEMPTILVHYVITGLYPICCCKICPHILPHMERYHFSTFDQAFLGVQL